jgi:hypothetical protein
MNFIYNQNIFKLMCSLEVDFVVENQDLLEEEP